VAKNGLVIGRKVTLANNGKDDRKGEKKELGKINNFGIGEKHQAVSVRPSNPKTDGIVLRS